MVSLVVLLVTGWSVAAPSSVPAVASAQAPAGDPLAGVEELILSGGYREAQARARQAQREARLRRDGRREALSLLLLAATELGTGDPAAASNFERSAALFAAQGDRFSAWMALWPLGLIERIQRQPEKAVAHHREALGLLREVEASSEQFAPDGLEYLSRWYQMPPDLLRVFRARPEAAKPTLLRIAQTMSRNAIVGALLDLGSLEEAELELSRARKLSDGLDRMFDEELAISLGDLRRRQWRLDEAREIFREALGRTSPPPVHVWEILGFLIEIEVASGRHEEALALSERALAAARGGKPHAEFSTLMLRAKALSLGGQDAAAEDALDRALQVARAAGDLLWQASVHKQLAHLALKAEQPEEAAARLETAVQILQTADAPDAEARTWLELSQVYARFDARANARAALEKARALAQQIDSRLLEDWVELMAAVERSRTGRQPAEGLRERLIAMLALPEVREVLPREDGRALLQAFSDLERLTAGSLADQATSAATGGERTRLADLRVLPLFVQGYAHYQRGELAAAREPWLAALAAAPRREFKMALLAMIGRSYGREGKDEEAVDHLIRAVAAVEQTVADVRLEEFVAGYLGDRQSLYVDLVDLLTRLGRPADAFDYAERARARAFLQSLGSPRLEPGHNGSQLAAEAGNLRMEIQSLERRLLAAPADERARLTAELRRARERYQSLLVRLKVTGRDAASSTHPEPQDLQTVREELAPATSLVSYFVSPSQVHAWVLDKESFRHVVLPAGAEDLRNAACWVDELRRQGGGRGARPLDPRCGGEVVRPEALYEKLVAPLRGDLRHRRLILVPHGELHYIPFAALRDPETGRSLLEDYTLTYAPSASSVGFLRHLESPVQGRALVLGEPEELDPALRSLPAARREAELVARLLGTRPLLGAEATERRLYELSGEVDLLHIAAHGIYDPANPLFSRIVLAPGGGRDGNLEVHEILAGLDLSGVNLVVLSACRTAVGERSSGDEVVGLTRALLDAGSPGVISTLWDIDDEAAAVLMEELYRRLVAGASAAEALREAQLALLRGSLYRDPRFWAAFSLTGDPQGRWHPAEPEERRP